MSPVIADLGFPLWLRAMHWINVLFIGFMIRSGIQILASFPRLYWNDGTTPGTEWLRFTKKQQPKDRLWTTLDEEVDASPVIAQPGGNNLGLGRHWHFFSLCFWILNGVVYVALLFITGQWSRLVPTSWSIFPDAWTTAVDYMTFHAPPAHIFTPYDPLQQLSYFAVVFILAPFQILTGLAQSPAMEGRFPWYTKIFGGRQGARSLHFAGLVAFIGFIIVHTMLISMVCACGPRNPLASFPGFVGNFGDIVLGQHDTNHREAVIAGVAIIAAILVIYAITVWYSLHWPRRAQHLMGVVIHPLVTAFTKVTTSRQHYTRKDISPHFLVNGAPPDSAEYLSLLWDNFAHYRLEIGGQVEHHLSLSLADLKALPKQTQITKHNCIQGWTGIAEWGGVPLREILNLCKPHPNVKFIVFYSYSQDTSGRQYYETNDIELAQHPQTILAYEMNGQLLPLAHGAPLRLRVETQLGFKMVKWLQSIEFVESFAEIHDGQGGSREDNKYYEQAVPI